MYMYATVWTHIALANLNKLLPSYSLERLGGRDLDYSYTAIRSQPFNAIWCVWIEQHDSILGPLVILGPQAMAGYMVRRNTMLHEDEEAL